jgi:uncharacterized protein YoxC
MKKNFVDYLATAGLIMILTFQVWHTAGLYLTYSRLETEKATIAAYFLSFTIEFMVFLFVYKGYETAGAWFAVCLFFVGILFNDNWDGSILTLDPFHLYLPKIFVSSTLLQFMSSLAIWYLTDIHVKARNEQGLNTRIQDLIKKEQDLNTSIQRLSNEVAQISSAVYDFEQDKKKLQQEITIVSKTLTDFKQAKQNIEQEIISLKKSKAGMSRKGAEV